MSVQRAFLKNVPFIAGGLLGIIVGFLAHQGWEQYRTHRLLTDDEAVMETLSQMVVLPEELPSVATVTDKEKLLDQPFFAKAENGDKVIIYKTSKRAYLFRPSEQKIIDMTVVAVEAPQTEDIPVFKANNE